MRLFCKPRTYGGESTLLRRFVKLNAKNKSLTVGESDLLFLAKSYLATRRISPNYYGIEKLGDIVSYINKTGLV